ncbi:MAG: Tic22 family protein [Thainema sp.]
MKALIRWGKTAGLIGGAVACSLLASGLEALALTQEQIIEKLAAVPVFTITDAQGSPLVASPQDGEGQGAVAGVFLSQEDAQSFLNRVTQQDPEVAGNVQVTPVSLGQVYQLAQRSSQENAGLQFAYFADDSQIQSAVELLQSSGQEISVEQFNGVPLFLARSTADGGYLTVTSENQQVIPVYFEREGLQRLLDRVEQQQSDLAGNVEIQVVSLQGVIATMESSDNPDLEQIMLIPPADSVEYIRSLQSGPSGQ